MTVLSNLYVEKVNSEHPLAVWMLNEDIDYISHITELDRNFSNSLLWQPTNCTISTFTPEPTDSPIKNTTISQISGSIPSLPTMDIEILSIYPNSFVGIVEEYGNFALGFYLYFGDPSSGAGNTLTQSVSYGYKYIDPITMLPTEDSVTETISSIDSKTWKFFTNTFANPDPSFINPRLFIRIKVSSGGGSGDYKYLINGFSFGQWSEDFNSSSLGVSTTLPMPTEIDLPTTLGVIEASSYNNNLPAYYVCSNRKLFCKNFGIPLVYGSSNVTKIYPNVISSVTYPSLVFPGLGFLHNDGKYNEYTAEMWIRINTDSADPKKIFGPIASFDGLYVEGGFLTLVLGNGYASHYVGEWYRPMLIDIRYIKNNISVLLNGEQVISIDFIEEDLSFPTALNQDWLGFYAYEDVHPISIDSFAIYSYSVPVEVAKRRWVWGQGVVAPETTNSALNATTAFSDYSFTKYAVNYNYPDFANWKQGFFSNIVTSSNVLSLPNYNLPEISVGSLSLVDWYDELKTEQSLVTDKYYSFRPSVSSPDQGYIYFKNFDLLNEPVQSFYCIMESDGTAVNEPLVKITNSITKDSLLIKLNGTTIDYILTINGVSATIQSKTISSNQIFTIGINLNNFSNIYEPSITLSGIQKFFSNQDALSLYVAGDSVTTFSGKIYRIGFDGAYNNRKINTFYNSNGIFDTANATQLISHVANYTLKAYEKYGIFFLDIASSGYWEDYMPLSYFGKYVTEYDGKSYYDLDSLQINVDYPEPLSTTAIETISSWTYSDIFTRYSNPVQQTYANFDNFIYSGWENYEDINQDSEKYFYYNTQNSSVRSYVSFQKISEGANKTLVDYQYKALPRSKNVIDPNTLTDIDPTTGAIPNNWENRAFELVDGTVIYPPKTYLNNNAVDFNDLAIVYHLDFTSEGLNHHPVRFRELQIASQVLERQKFTEIGTRFGTSVYPYTKTGFYYDFKGKNPLAVYKGSTPYLYNNRHSGWRMIGDFSTLVERGISVPVNVQKGLNTQISSMQIWGRFSEKYFPQSETMFMSVDHKNGTYDFYFIADESTQRGKIFAKDRSTGAIITNIQYHINGQFVGTPLIVNEEWFVLGIAFTELLDFDQYTGRINLNGPLIYNNISYYLATNLEQEQRVETRSWGQVKNNGSPVIWDYWQNTFTWSEVKIISTSNVYSIDPSDIYKKYVGSDRIIIDDSIEGILLDPEKLKIYGDISWSTATKIPV